MEVLAHPDPFVLEAELLDRVAGAQRDNPWTPVLIVVPTRGLGRHVARRIAERFGARLAVETIDHRALARRAQDAAGIDRLRMASAALIEEIVVRAAGLLRDGPLRRFLEARPGARRALAETLQDLREAGITPAALAAAVPRGDREIAEIYSAYVGELAQLAERGLVDEAGLVAAALPHVGRLGARFGAIFHHGAYELTGVHLDLVRALDAVTPVTFLLPGDPGGHAHRTATAFAAEFLSTDRDSIRRAADRPGGLIGSRLACLYDESAEPAALPPGGVRFDHAQGARAELTLATRLALRAAGDDGVPPHEIAIVARTLGPYAAAIEEVLDGEEIPWSGPLDLPLRRDPWIHDLLLLLRVVADDFPRAATAEWLGSPRLDWSRLLPSEPPPAGDRAEAWSRSAGILGGLDAWRRELPAWAGSARDPADADDPEGARTRAAERRLDAERLVRALAACARVIEPRRKRRFSEHAALVERVARTCLVPAPGDAGADPVRAALSEILEEITDLERALGDAREVSFSELVERLERRVSDARLPVRPRDEGGIRVLDAMQARGLTFRRVFLIGMHAGLFPRTPRADPFLDDEIRDRLRRATARPIARKTDGEAEERILLSMILGSCGESLAVSWQRSDDAGKAKAASIALREVARVTLGAADLDRLVRVESRGIPAHPEQALERLRADPGLLAPEEAALLVALRSVRPEEAIERLGPRARGLEQGLALLSETERSFPPGDARYDGRCSPRSRATPISVTALERLGGCPLRYFFGDVLRLREPVDEAGPFDLDSREIGLRVHDLLHRVFGALFDEGLLAGDREPEARARAVALVRELWAAVNHDLDDRLGRDAPVLWEHLSRAWIEALAGFVASECARLATEGVESIEGEAPHRVVFELAPLRGLEVAGRFDRIVRTADGRVRVGDYKTGRDLAAYTSVSAMLKGHRLQAPLYRELSGGIASVEFLGVGPRHAEESDDEAHKVFEGFPKPGQREGFHETIRVLTGLESAGRFPIRPDPRRCSHCPYRRACRYNHPPTSHRHDTDRELADFRDLQKKNRDRPSLADVRAAAGDSEPDE